MLGIYGSDVSRGDVVRAADMGATDLSMLEGSSLFGPKLPFVPGYEIAAVVEAIGSGVTNFELGQRVAALTVYAGFAELLVRAAEVFLRSPVGSPIAMRLR